MITHSIEINSDLLNIGASLFCDKPGQIGITLFHVSPSSGKRRNLIEDEVPHFAEVFLSRYEKIAEACEEALRSSELDEAEKLITAFLFDLTGTRFILDDTEISEFLEFFENIDSCCSAFAGDQLPWL